MPPVVLWLRLWASNAGGEGSASDWGTKIPHAPRCGPKQNKRMYSHQSMLPEAFAWKSDITQTLKLQALNRRARAHQYWGNRQHRTEERKLSREMCVLSCSCGIPKTNLNRKVFRLKNAPLWYVGQSWKAGISGGKSGGNPTHNDPDPN